MKTIKARYDGRVIIPEEPVDLPLDEQFSVGLPDPPEAEHKTMTGAEMVASGLVGGWVHRTDLPDTLEFARQLREQSNNRKL